MSRELTHIDPQGGVRMVDVGGKPDTVRTAVAATTVRLSPKTMQLLQEKALPKGDVLSTAKIAGIQAAKQTHHLIPMCHPLLLSQVDLRFEPDLEASAVRIEAEVRTTSATGVEMEALVAAQVAALTIYDMCKAVQKDICITDCRLLHKSGGRSGPYDAPSSQAAP
jgi:cyclic pyranopterin phosphate synthase